MKKIIIGLKIFDDLNVKNFNKADLFDEEKRLELKFNCVICGRKTSLGYSTSREGHNLICNDCYNNEFENADEAIAFIEDKKIWKR